MSNQSPARARRVPVRTDGLLVGGHRYDYADAFEIRLRDPEARPAEALVRVALQASPWPVRWGVWIAHRYLLGLQLGPRSAPDHIFGWRIRTSEPDMVHLEAESPSLRGAIVLRREARDTTRAVLATYVFFTRRGPARLLWLTAGPLHRRIAPYLLERAAAAVDRPAPEAANHR